MHSIKNLLVTGAADLPMGVDIFFKDEQHPRPVVIYVHGFNGFKDWGNFDLIACRFAEAGFVLVKFNFSHNGTSPERPEDFVNLQAFGENNYTKELEDLTRIIDWVTDPFNPYHAVIDAPEIYLMGHSLGGGISILQAATDERIKKIITWAAINECKTPWGKWPVTKMQEWKQTGVQYYTNSRTNQQMPMYYQLYKDYINNADRLNIRKAISNLTIPILICHGTLDASVPVENAFELKAWQPAAELFTVAGDHVFGRKHPWLIDKLPSPTEALITASLQFIR